jgi:hypothetical protein
MHRWIIFVGGVLAVTALAWVVFDSPFAAVPAAIELSVPTVGAPISDVGVPPEEIEAIFVEVRSKIQTRAATYLARRRVGGIFDWVAFVLGAVVTVIAGVLGSPPDSGVGGNPRSPKWLAWAAGIIAALGTVGTGAASRLGDQAEAARSEAIQMRDAFVEAQAQIAEATSPEEVRRILERLRTIDL